MKRWGIGILCVLVSGQIGCGSETTLVAGTGESNDDALQYSFQTRMLGLDETVTYVKSATELYVLRESGRVQTVAELNSEERDARFQRFGRLSPAFARRVMASPKESPLWITVHFTPEVDWAALTLSLSTGSDGERLASRLSLRQAIASRAAELIEELTTLGVKDVFTRGNSMPVLFGRALPATIETLARHPGVSLVTTAENSKVILNAAPKNGVTDPQIDTTFNSLGLFADGQKIGMVENALDGLFEPHDAFEFVTPDPGTGYRVTYQVEPLDCESDFDCPASSFYGQALQKCETLGHAGHKGQCVAEHASQCMSVAVGSEGGSPFGAARARIYYPNRGGTPTTPGTIPDPSVACSPTGLADAYDWMDQEGVTTVNESFGCENMFGDGAAEGITQDWYARYYDMAIFKAAGNQKFSADDAACPFSLNGNCVGGINSAGEISCFSSWTNLNSPTFERTDREEPDIMALAGYGNRCQRGSLVDVMKVGSTSSWTGNAGTSFAAPAMAGLTALLKEACGGDLHHNAVRVILRNAGWTRNVTDYRYSTPVTPANKGYDWKDGGGALYASAALAFCKSTGPGPDNDSGSDPGCLDCGGPPPFDGRCQNCGPVPPGEKRLQSATPFGAGDGRLYNLYWKSGGVMAAGKRIRTSVAWDSCPASVSGMAPAEVETDIDVVLVNRSKNEAIYGSQSVTDSVEGFDVTLPSDGEYELYWTNPKGAKGCGNTGFEPFYWAVTWWS